MYFVLKNQLKIDKSVIFDNIDFTIISLIKSTITFLRNYFK